ncbi:Holliday junction branch migration DNA helicase RuvB [[Mycoplasma] mobile]|nr:Holliday junction branch migration DNA helicase RuvB [[Mycoplasma] mobile]
MKKNKFPLIHRPNSFNEFIGQKNLKHTLKVLIKSSILRKENLDHLIFQANPGYGKTSLAYIISKEMNSNLKIVQGNQFEKKSDLLSLFVSVNENDIIFVDEIHAINKSIEEILYSVMDDFVIDIQIGPEGEKKIVRMNLPHFTLIGATTQIEKLSKPLIDRFGFVGKFSSYNENEINLILKNLARKLKIKIDEQALKLISMNSSYIPRIAINLLKRAWDFAIFDEKKSIDITTIKKAFNYLGIFENGLNILHIKYLKLLYQAFKNKSASLDAISSILGLSKNNVVFHIESNLLNLELIEKTSRGRKIRKEGIEYLNKNNFK